MMIIPELTSHYTTIENDMDMDTYIHRAKDTDMATDKDLVRDMDTDEEMATYKDMESTCAHL